MAPHVHRVGGAHDQQVQHRLQPMSFYNGSVWPFDTAIAANGLKEARLRPGVEPLALAFSRRPSRTSTPGSRSFSAASAAVQPATVSFPMACWPTRPPPGPSSSSCSRMLEHLRTGRENVVYVHNPVLAQMVGEVRTCATFT